MFEVPVLTFVYADVRNSTRDVSLHVGTHLELLSGGSVATEDQAK